MTSPTFLFYGCSLSFPFWLFHLICPFCLHVPLPLTHYHGALPLTLFAGINVSVIVHAGSSCFCNNIPTPSTKAAIICSIIKSSGHTLLIFLVVLYCFESVIRHVNNAFHKTNERLVVQAILRDGFREEQKVFVGRNIYMVGVAGIVCFLYPLFRLQCLLDFGYSSIPDFSPRKHLSSTKIFFSILVGFNHTTLFVCPPSLNFMFTINQS